MATQVIPAHDATQTVPTQATRQSWKRFITPKNIGIAAAAIYGTVLLQYAARRSWTSYYTAQQPLQSLARSYERMSDDKQLAVRMFHAHGFGCDAGIFKAAQMASGLPDTIQHIVPDFGDGPANAPSALGGPRDRAVFTAAIQTCNSNVPIILSGVSRGGAVAAVVDGKYAIPNHVGTILESAPAHFGDVVDNLAGPLSKIPTLTTWAHALMNWIPKFWHYKPTGLQPIDVIHKGKQPLLIVASATDSLIPAQSTIKNYRKAVEAGREVYLKLIPGLHHLYQGGHGQLAGRYTDVQNAFIARCTGTATADQIALLNELQPTVAQLRAKGY